MTVNIADAKISEALVEEINSIKAETGVENTVTYEPKAWTREGRTD